MLRSVLIAAEHDQPDQREQGPTRHGERALHETAGTPPSTARQATEAGFGKVMFVDNMVRESSHQLRCAPIRAQGGARAECDRLVASRRGIGRSRLYGASADVRLRR